MIRLEIIFSISWIVLLFVMHRTDSLSRLVFGYFIVFNTVLTYLARLCFKQYMVRIYKNSKYSSRLLLVTDSKKMEEVIRSLEEYKE